MSESTSSPAPTGQPTSTEGASSPPANTQTPISVSEAARTLREQRRTQQPQPARPLQADRPPIRPVPSDRPQAPAEAQPRQADAPAQQPAAEPRRESGPDAVDALAKALGLPDGVGAPGQAAAQPLAPSVEIDGRHYTTEQLKSLVSQGTDYTRKTQELAQQRQQVAQQQEALAQVLPLLQPELYRLQQQVQGVNRPDPSLLDIDPNRYHREHALWEQSREEQARLGQLSQLQQQALERAMSEQVERSNKALSDQLPGWSDAKQRGEWQQAIASWAIERGGYNRDELRGLADHRHLLSLAKAMMFDRLVSTSKTSAPLQAAPVRGTSPPPAPAARISAAEQSFAEKPSIRNATQLIMARRGATNGAAR